MRAHIGLGCVARVALRVRAVVAKRIVALNGMHCRDDRRTCTADPQRNHTEDSRRKKEEDKCLRATDGRGHLARRGALGGRAYSMQAGCRTTVLPFRHEHVEQGA